MKRTTLSLPDALAQALEREARRRSTSASAIAREALLEHLHLVPGDARPLPFAALGRSGHRTTARDMEQLLAREWDDNARDR
jgi:predicted transcriptional regulator